MPGEDRTFWGQQTFCIVTGASQGIGRSFAVEFARNFAKNSVIVLLARSFRGLQATNDLIAAANPDVKVILHVMDLYSPNPSEFNKIIAEAASDVSQFKLAVVVHNAGSLGNCSQLTSEMNDLAEWNRFMSLNLYSVTALTAEFLKIFNLGQRCLVNITSLCAIQPVRSLGYYCIGKASREMYFKTLAEEDPSLDILNYSPGPVNTGMITDLIQSVKSDDTKNMFESMKSNGTLVSLPETTAKAIEVLKKGKYKSGGRVDYFDDI
ncbi:sepiapterin reductase [Nilaparvata lugens]|uniref:sepiapterin reductase n=1 Tax=Nilaparvata lugens TaxID=108931 RepID=UPI00193EB123|nr:sepiapterin reductase [Nilaparvata lugens]XP_039283656.1 sepiapterin reductase [Nilaparvata lugens]